jgi:cation diffusion facilitator family transporter
MIKFIIKLFIKDYDNVDDKKVRERYGVLSGVLGVICNLLLFMLKLSIGIFVNSIAIISDAFNNVSDLGSSIVTIFGVKLSNRPPDEGHPYGHGRYEYITSLVVSFLIFAVGLETLKSSINKIINPSRVEINSIMILILSSTILLKVWMFSYNKYIGEKINSSVNKANASDSLNDVLATVAVIIGTVIGKYTNLPIDGILGFIISFVIMYSGFSIAKDSVSLLLGESPDPELINRIKELILENEHIIGVHDLIIHDYGPNKIMASIHAEVSKDANIVDIHYEIDKIEQRIGRELDIDIVIHMDPVEE